jgi:type IV secretion/conjugal transfer VirB4 family ATPase
MDPLSALALAFGGFAGARLADWLRDYQPARRGLVDLLPWAFLVETAPQGIVLNKNGSFSAAFEVQGPDRASSTEEELNALTLHASRAFAPFVTAWTFHFDAVRREAPGYPPPGHFPDPVTRLLDECRRDAYLRQGALFESSSILTATFRPPREVYQHILVRLQQGVRQERRTWEATLQSFQAQLAALHSRLGGPLRLRALGGPELLAHFHSCVTGESHPVNDPGPGVYLDQVLSSRHMTGGWEPAVGSRHFEILSLFHLPGRMTAAHLDALNDVPFSYRMSIRFTPLDIRAAQKVIDTTTRGWFWMQKSARDMLLPSQQPQSPGSDPFTNRFAVDMLDDGADATQVNQASEHRFAYLTSCFLIPGDSRSQAHERALALSKVLEDRGYTTRVETYNAMAAFHGSLPGETTANLRAPLVNTLPIADMLPLTAIWPGLKSHPCQFFPPTSPPILIGRTEGSTPFRLNLHTGDLGHTIVVGPPGAGKSTLLTALAVGWLRYPESRVYLFDRDHSARLLAKAIEARYYDIGQEEISFQPLRHLDSEAEQAVALSWLEALFALQLGKLTPQQSDALAKAIKRLGSTPPHLRTLSVLHTQVQDPDLRFSLSPFIKEGPYASLLDGANDSIHDGRVQIFEMRRLLELEEKAHLPILLYLLNRIETSLDGAPTLIILDEAGLALLHEIFASRINQWALTLRKKNAVLVLALQALTQLQNNNSFSTLLQSCPSRIYLSNSDATSPAVRPIYEACGLNPRQIELIAKARKKRDYYLNNPDGSRLFGLALTPADLAFMGTLPGRSLQETHAAMDHHREVHGRRWTAAWLRTCGLPDEADALDHLSKE